MLALLSPSKTLDMGPCPPRGAAGEPKFLAQSQKLVAILKQQSEAQLKQLMGISDKLAALNHARYQGFETPFTPTNAKQAVFMFKGDVYDGLDIDTLGTTSQDYLNEHVRILSGLYGVLKPYDLMQPYRLEMGTKLQNERGKNLYEFWGARLAEALNAEGSEVVVNLASNEYSKAVDRAALKAQWVDITFKEHKGDDYKVIGLFAKKARGMMARYIAENRVDAVDKLKSFDVAGYEFHNALSNESELVFTRSTT